MSELIRLENICMNFTKSGSIFQNEKSVKVLKNINLNISESDITVFVGESGCGKTTLGKIVVGLLRPTSGKVYFQNADINKITVSKKEYKNNVQFVQQDSYAALNPIRTIYQSLFAPIKNKYKTIKKSEIDNKIIELMDLVGLNPAEQFTDKFPHQLSGGQRQRICLARAVSLDPKLIVADEPVSMIDVSLRLSILDIMKELNERFNISFIYITHDLATANYFANGGKMCVMYLGEIVEQGSVKDILSAPFHPYTRALIAAVPTIDFDKDQINNEIPLKTMELADLTNRTEGCSFFSRCLYSKKKCTFPIDYVQIGKTKVLCCNLEEVPHEET